MKVAKDLVKDDGLFVNSKRVKSCSVLDMQFANKLNSFLKEEEFLPKESSTSKSAEQFRLLREKDGYDETLINNILQYYIDHFEDRRMPDCFSSKSFREKFLILVKHKEKNNPDISKEAMKVVEQLTKNKHWPRGSDQELPLCVQLSMNNVGKWLKKFDSLNKRLTEQLSTFPKKISDLADTKRMEWHKINQTIKYMDRMKETFWWTPDKFVYYWFLEFHDGLEKWTDWSGSLKGEIVTTLHRRFNGMFLDFTVQYCGNTERWKNLQQMIKDVK